MLKTKYFPSLLLYISLGFLLLFSSCATRKIKVETSKALFFTNQLEVPKSSLLVDFVLPYDSLLTKLNIKKGVTIFDMLESTSTDPLQIKLLNTPSISKHKDEIHLSNCQLGFKAKPSIAGINAGWIEGSIKANLALTLANQSLTNIQFKDTNYSYQWLTTPQVKVMGFPVNVSSLLDKYIKSKERVFKEAILANINSKVDVNEWLPKVKQTILNQPFGAYQLISNELALDVVNFKFEDQQVIFRSKIEGPLGLTLKDSTPFSYQIKGSESNVVMYYANLASLQSMFDHMVQNYSSYSNTKLNLNNISTNGFGLEVLGMFGKKSQIIFDCGIGINQSKIYFSAENIRLQHIGFPYQFFKNKIRRKLASSIEKMTVDIPKMLSSDLPNELFKDISFKEIRTNPSGVLLVGKINNAVVKIYP